MQPKQRAPLTWQAAKLQSTNVLQQEDGREAAQLQLQLLLQQPAELQLQPPCDASPPVDTPSGPLPSASPPAPTFVTPPAAPAPSPPEPLDPSDPRRLLFVGATPLPTPSSLGPDSLPVGSDSPAHAPLFPALRLGPPIAGLYVPASPFLPATGPDAAALADLADDDEGYEDDALPPDSLPEDESEAVPCTQQLRVAPGPGTRAKSGPSGGGTSEPGGEPVTTLTQAEAALARCTLSPTRCLQLVQHLFRRLPEAHAHQFLRAVQGGGEGAGEEGPPLPGEGRDIAPKSMPEPEPEPEQVMKSGRPGRGKKRAVPEGTPEPDVIPTTTTTTTTTKKAKLDGGAAMPPPPAPSPLSEIAADLAAAAQAGRGAAGRKKTSAAPAPALPGTGPLSLALLPEALFRPDSELGRVVMLLKGQMKDKGRTLSATLSPPLNEQGAGRFAAVVLPCKVKVKALPPGAMSEGGIETPENDRRKVIFKLQVERF